jgi:prevent-host-death family protein
MAHTVNTHEAKTNFSQLLRQVQAGEEIVIAKSGTPVARLVPIVHDVITRSPGSAKGKVVLAGDFDAPLPAELVAEFES